MQYLYIVTNKIHVTFFQIYRIKPKKIYLPVYETSNLKINHNIGITCTCHKGRLCLLATSFIKQNNLISV